MKKLALITVLFFSLSSLAAAAAAEDSTAPKYNISDYRGQVLVELSDGVVLRGAEFDDDVGTFFFAAPTPKPITLVDANSIDDQGGGRVPNKRFMIDGNGITKVKMRLTKKGNDMTITFSSPNDIGYYSNQGQPLLTDIYASDLWMFGLIMAISSPFHVLFRRSWDYMRLKYRLQEVL